jgi:hypothetical protein
VEEEIDREEPESSQELTLNAAGDTRYFMAYKDSSFEEYIQKTGLPVEPSYVQPEHEKLKPSPAEQEKKTGKYHLAEWQHNTEDGPVKKHGKSKERDWELKNVNYYSYAYSTADDNNLNVNDPAGAQPENEDSWDENERIAQQNHMLLMRLDERMTWRESKIRAMDHHITALREQLDEEQRRCAAKHEEVVILKKQQDDLREDIAVNYIRRHHDEDKENRKPKQHVLVQSKAGRGTPLDNHAAVTVEDYDNLGWHKNDGDAADHEEDEPFYD